MQGLSHIFQKTYVKVPAHARNAWIDQQTSSV